MLPNSAGVFLQLLCLCVGVPSPSHHYLMGEDNKDLCGSAHRQRLQSQGPRPWKIFDLIEFSLVSCQGCETFVFWWGHWSGCALVGPLFFFLQLFFHHRTHASSKLVFPEKGKKFKDGESKRISFGKQFEFPFWQLKSRHVNGTLTGAATHSPILDPCEVHCTHISSSMHDIFLFSVWKEEMQAAIINGISLLPAMIKRESLK